MKRLALLLALLAGPAGAQTMAEAVAANAGLAMTLCLQTVPDQATLNAAFAAAGFVHAPEDFGGGEILHRFNAPADTVTVMVVGQGRDGFCAISTSHMGVTAALAFAQAMLDRLHPGVFQFGEMEGAAAVVTPQNPGPAWRECTGYIGWFGQRPVTVAVGTAGQDPGCVEDGTSQIMISM
jgi:hypothetical protein